MTDLFCGAGVGAVGWKRAGYNIIYATDFNEYAVKTYNLNIGNHATVRDISTVQASELPDADVITGGFPCTPFSLAGTGKGSEDERLGNLGYHFFRLIKEKQPKAFIAENVEGITLEKHQSFFFSLIRWFGEAGYNVAWKVFDCWQYGVPQVRRRVFIVGIRKDLERHYIWPEPVPVHERTTMRDAIYDIRKVDEETQKRVHNHDFLTAGFSPRSLDQNRQRTWDEPAYTIVSNARHLGLHPDPSHYDFRSKTKDEVHEDEKNGVIRRFTVRECLRLQSVPDEYYFPDEPKWKRTTLLAKQYERCSGIPPIVSEKLGRQLADILTGNIDGNKTIQKKLF